jgi:magnesium transporter
MRAQLQTMQRDVTSSSDHATYLSNKVMFLLDALLGVVSIQQNDIINIFSIAAVVFMPPTLVASIYGMNFHSGMIELDWSYGYPWALFLMVVAAVGPLVVFKWKKWL